VQSFSVGSRIITVRVGTGEKQVEHQLHESVLVKSPFFQACLATNWKEGKEGMVDLPEEDPETFALLVEWLYSERIEPENAQDDGRLIDAYKLACKYGLPVMQNLLIPMIRAALADYNINPRLVLSVWTETPEISKLRHMLLDKLACDLAKDFKAYTGCPGDDFKEELVKLL
jgi:hypothetical protein